MIRIPYSDYSTLSELLSLPINSCSHNDDIQELRSDLVSILRQLADRETARAKKRQQERKVCIHRSVDDWQTMEVSYDDIFDIHWDDVSGAGLPIRERSYSLYGYITYTKAKTLYPLKDRYNEERKVFKVRIIKPDKDTDEWVTYKQLMLEAAVNTKRLSACMICILELLEEREMQDEKLVEMLLKEGYNLHEIRTEVKTLCEEGRIHVMPE